MQNDFQIAADLKGLMPVDPFVDLPTGAYKVKIVDIEKKASKNSGTADNIFFSVIVSNGPYSGAPQTLIMNSDWSKEFVRRVLLTALRSIGQPAANLNGSVQFNASQFLNKEAHIYVKAAIPGEQQSGGEKEYADRNFITPEAYARLSQVQPTPQAPAGALATGGQAPVNGVGAPAGFTPTTPQPTGAPNLALNF